MVRKLRGWKHRYHLFSILVHYLRHRLDENKPADDKHSDRQEYTGRQADEEIFVQETHGCTPLKEDPADDYLRYLP